jgi:hypothetical protein
VRVAFSIPSGPLSLVNYPVYLIVYQPVRVICRNNVILLHCSVEFQIRHKVRNNIQYTINVDSVLMNSVFYYELLIISFMSSSFHFNGILHYESSKEHITYKWINYIQATKERVM